MENTIGYILCCQSPALFLLAIALLIRFFVRKDKARVRAIVSLIAALACIAAGVVLYYQGLLLEYFTLRTLWQIRTAGWIGLAMVAALLLYLSGRAFVRYAARRRAQKEAVRAENAHRQEVEQARAEAYEAGRASVMSDMAAAEAEAGAQVQPAEEAAVSVGVPQPETPDADSHTNIERP